MARRARRFLIALVLVALAVQWPAAAAASLRAISDDTLARSSAAAVHGRVAEVTSAWDAEVETIYTYVTLEVLRAWGLEGAPARVVVKQLGGVGGRHRVRRGRPGALRGRRRSARVPRRAAARPHAVGGRARAGQVAADRSGRSRGGVRARGARHRAVGRRGARLPLGGGPRCARGAGRHPRQCRRGGAAARPRRAHPRLWRRSRGAVLHAAEPFGARAVAPGRHGFGGVRGHPDWRPSAVCRRWPHATGTLGGRLVWPGLAQSADGRGARAAVLLEQ